MDKKLYKKLIGRLTKVMKRRAGLNDGSVPSKDYIRGVNRIVDLLRSRS